LPTLVFRAKLWYKKKCLERRDTMTIKPLIITVLSLGMAETAFAHGVVVGNTNSSECYQSVLSSVPGRDAAIRKCKKALNDPLAREKDKAAIYVNIGIMQGQNLDYEASLKSYENAIAINPDLADIYLNQAVTLIYTGQYKASVESSTKALELGSKKQARILVNRAMAYEGLKQHNRAYQDLKSAIEINPNWELAREAISNYKVISKTS